MNKIISTNPGRGYKKIGSVKVSTKGEIVKKVAQAQNTKLTWKETPLEKRIDYFKKLIKVYKKRNGEVAKLQTQEMGRPITESLNDVSFDIENMESKIKLAKKYLATEILDETDTQKNVLYLEPHGVVAVIVPWNYPSSNFFISCTQLLLAGNTIVFKHSEECPLTGKLLAKIMDEACFPKGVFSAVHGDGKVGDLLTSQDIDAIHFTGSSKVGQYLYEKAAKKFIPVVLEMGGSSPGIIFPDANIDSACSNACAERFNNCGQICCALKRLIVHEDIFEKVVTKMKQNVEAMKIGYPMDKNTRIGPLVAKRQLNLLVKQVEDAKSKGAKIITGGNPVAGLDGAYYQPTIMTNVKPNMRILTEEVFGPVLPISSFKTEEEAIELANKTIYGLSAYVYGKDVKKMKKVSSRINSGQISINGASYFSENSPFGGYKMSGMGRNDGKFGFLAATQMKVVAEPK